MYTKEHCKNLQNVAYRSCLDAFFDTKDEADIRDYWLYLFETKKYCEAKGVEKALELIEIYKELRH